MRQVNRERSAWRVYNGWVLRCFLLGPERDWSCVLGKGYAHEIMGAISTKARDTW